MLKQVECEGFERLFLWREPKVIEELKQILNEENCEEHLETFVIAHLGFFDPNTDCVDDSERLLMDFSLYANVEIEIEHLWIMLGFRGEFSFEELLDGLVERGYLNKNNQRYSMHRIIGNVISKHAHLNWRYGLLDRLSGILYNEESDSALTYAGYADVVTDNLQKTFSDPCAPGSMSLFELCYELSSLYIKLGDTSKAKLTIKKAENLLFRGCPSKIIILGEFEIQGFYKEIGDLYFNLKEYNLAFENYLECFNFRKRLYDEKPNNVTLTELLADSHEYIGNSYYRLNDYNLARENYLECCTIWKELSEKNPNNERHRYMADIYEKLCDALHSLHDDKSAFDNYLECHNLGKVLQEKKKGVINLLAML